jgi:hypothetical protein
VIRIAIIITSIYAVISPALADSIYCSTSFQGYRVCQDSQGYHSTEWDRGGMTIGQDSDGRRWTTSRWQGIEMTTVTPPGWDGR